LSYFIKEEADSKLRAVKNGKNKPYYYTVLKILDCTGLSNGKLFIEHSLKPKKA
jgi:hypothetical protein